MSVHDVLARKSVHDVVALISTWYKHLTLKYIIRFQINIFVGHAMGVEGW